MASATWQRYEQNIFMVRRRCCKQPTTVSVSWDADKWSKTRRKRAREERLHETNWQGSICDPNDASPHVTCTHMPFEIHKHSHSLPTCPSPRTRLDHCAVLTWMNHVPPEACLRSSPRPAKTQPTERSFGETVLFPFSRHGSIRRARARRNNPALFAVLGPARLGLRKNRFQPIHRYANGYVGLFVWKEGGGWLNWMRRPFKKAGV